MKILKFLISLVLLSYFSSIYSYGYSPIKDTILNRIESANKLKQSNPESALEILQNALELAITEEERSGELSANSAIGAYHFERNEFDKSIESYQKAIQISEELDSLRLKGLTLMRVGNIYFSMGRFDIAKTKMDAALSIFRAKKLRLNEGQALGNLGNVNMMLGQNELALDNYKTAYQIAKDAKDESLEIGMGFSISYYHLISGNGEAALPFINRSLEYNSKEGNKKEIAMSYGNLGYAYSLMGEYEKAFENYQHCVDTAQKYEFTRVESDTYKDISETYKKSGDYKKSMDALTQYYELRDSLMGRATQDKVSELEIQFETVEQKQQIEQLEQQKQVRNLQIGLLVIGLGLLAMIGWFAIQKQEDNLVEKQEIIAKNEEIYRLEKELIEKELQQKALEQQRITAKAKVLEDSNKELETFAHVVAHDLREPLRMINFYIQRIKRTLDEESLAKTAEYFDFALDGSLRMNKLIKGILNLATVQQQELKLKPIELNDIALVAKQNLQETIEEKKAIVQYSDLPKINGDKLQLIQLFQNLISNGIKYNTQEQPKISISHRILDNQIEIAFEDNGIGIAEENQDTIFKMFNRLENHRFSGTGIGLATCQKIVERHKGTIQIQSKQNEGTRFIIKLPK